MDGVIVHRAGAEPVRVDDLVDPSALAGVEVFTGASGVPMQYAGASAGCGTLVLWTRR